MVATRVTGESAKVMAKSILAAGGWGGKVETRAVRIVKY